MQKERVTLEIYGLGCGGGGALAVERALIRIHGVAHAYANPATETAYVQYDPALVQPSAHLYDDLDIDSIDAVDLIVRLKELTGRKVSPEEFKAVRTVADVVDAIENLLRT